jgi:opine dehydrogenase
MAALGAAAGVPTTVIDGLVSLARVAAGRDFAETARTRDRLGLAGMEAAQIRRTVREGFA